METNFKTADEKNAHFAGKYFDEIEEISDTDNYFVPVLKDVAKFLDVKAAKVLDVGCGTGLFMKSILDMGCTNCYGVDGKTDFANLALERGYKEVKQVEDLNISMLPFDDEVFDLVVCKDVFEHLLNPTHAFLEIKRVLKPNGFFLLHVPNHFTLGARVKFLFSNNIDTFSFFKGESRWTFPHIRFYEYNDSVKILNTHNFSLVENLSYHFPEMPFLNRIGLFKNGIRKLSKKYPNQFAGGYSLLSKKN